MANITNASVSWQSVMLTAEEVWQCREGVVDIDTDATNQLGLGLRLHRDDSVRLSAGKTVYYRLSSGIFAVIARVAV